MWKGSEARACPCDLNTSLPPRSLSTAGTLAQPFSSSEHRDAASHPQTRGPPVPRRATEPSTPRSRAQRRPSGRASPLWQRAASFPAGRALVAETGEWTHLGWPEPGVAGWHGLKNQTNKKFHSPLGYKISYGFMAGTFETTGKREIICQKPSQPHLGVEPVGCPPCPCVCLLGYTGNGNGM